MSDLKAQIERLDLEEGDIILVRSEVMTGMLKRGITDLMPEGCTALFLLPGESIEKLTEAEMEQAGWVRKDKQHVQDEIVRL